MACSSISTLRKPGSGTRRDEALIAAYRATAYAIHHRPGRARPIVVRVDRAAPRLDALLRRFGACRAVIITADNPRSEPRSEPLNRMATRRLAWRVRRAGFSTLPTRAHADDEDWPVEYGLLVLGIAMAQALEIAAAFRQNAVVELRLGRPPRLRASKVLAAC